MSNYTKNQSSYTTTTSQQIAYNSSASKKVTRYRGCTCDGKSPCRATCRTVFVQ
ncbi:hypothetical protein J4208_03330 [Candidatus Woesearchaeota archaeon]|nr:hypothetical protein [Candidatus Woesearchaeota archaeon]